MRRDGNETAGKDTGNEDGERVRMPNWKLTLAYDGTDYHGWQVQPGQVTVQGELQLALQRITGESPLPQGSGRTDAGVHALGQVASFALAAPIPGENLQRALNRILPTSIRVLSACPVADGFHARHSARAKTYEYRIDRGALCSPFQVRYVHVCRWPLELAAMQAAAQTVVGRHDFRSFAASDPELRERGRGADGHETGSQSAGYEDAQPEDSATLGATMGTTVREIFSSQWAESNGHLLVYRVRGSGFLHHMVRNLVGTMLEIGRGQFARDAMVGILAARSRAAAGPTAPACGLFLHSVEYDEADDGRPQTEELR